MTEDNITCEPAQNIAGYDCPVMFSQRTAWILTLNRFTEAHHAAVAGGGKIFDLTTSNPTQAGFAPAIASIFAALANPQLLTYDPQPKGLFSARLAVADYYRDQHALELDAEAIVLTTSTSEAYSHVFRLLCDYQDEVLVPKPSYPLFDFLADLNDVKLVPYPLLYDCGWQIDLPSLQGSITNRTRAIILVNPNNPTGSFVSQAERVALSALCREHNLGLIVDEVFLDYAIDGRRHPSFAANVEALTFTLSGISKISGLPQMKLAWVAISGPTALANEALGRIEIVADTYLSMNAPIQLAAEALLAERLTLQPAMKKRIEENLAELDRQLSLHPQCERLQLEGGWYAVLRVPATQADEELAIQILQATSVLLHPGHFFDFPRDGFLILSLITPVEDFCMGVERLLGFLNR